MRFRLLQRVVEQYREWLSPRGRSVLWVTAALAVMGLNTKENQVFKVFAVAAALLLVAALFAVLRPPRVELNVSLPERATAGRPLPVSVRLGMAGPLDGAGPHPHGVSPRDSASPRGPRALSSLPLMVSFPRSGPVVVEPRQSLLVAEETSVSIRHSVTLEAPRRGRYLVRGPTVRRTDPLGLVGSRPLRLRDRVLLVYPRFYSMSSFRLPLGRRYQPGGIPLASHTGDSLEFLGTREYRQGDPIRHIHWRSWARVGEPVVMEFQEEYFSRIALILDTFLPRRARGEEVDGFEAAISVVASVADYFSRSEYVVDIFAAGPDIYEVSAGRSLAYLENILDVLACLEPCREPPFDVVGPALFEKLQQITSVVAVVQDWDDAREEFLRKVKSFGVDMRVLIVREGATRKDWSGAADALSDVSLLHPTEIEQALASEGGPV